MFLFFFFFSSRRRHTRSKRDWSSDVCSSDLDSVLSGRGVDDPAPRAAPAATKSPAKLAGRKAALPAALAPQLASLAARSEERRVGKECRCRWSAEGLKEDKRVGQA